jgi:hypothetical protein
MPYRCGLVDGLARRDKETVTTKERRIAGIATVEFITAMGMLGLVLSCFTVALNGVRRLERRAELENRAIIVLYNVVERLEAEQTRNAAKTETILDQEFKNSELAGESGLSARYVIGAKAGRLVISRADGKPIAETELPGEQRR